VAAPARAGMIPPSGAIQGGYESGGTPLDLCSAYFQGGLYPGKVVADGTCNIGWHHQEIAIAPSTKSFSGFSWLVNPENEPLVWVSISQGQSFPPTTVNSGYEADGTPLFVCRANYNGTMQPGKVIAKGTCNFGWNHQEIAVPNYQVLVSLIEPFEPSYIYLVYPE